MKHFALMLAAAVCCGATAAQAQTTNASPDRAYVEVTGGPTFGHKVAGSVGVEGGYWILPYLGAFLEAGHMTNVVTSSTESDARLIGSAINASPSPKTGATYFDVGAMYRIPAAHGRIHPYALFGIGAARVTNTTKFTIGGSDITGQIANYGAQLGSDLSGSYTKVFATVGFGVHIPFGSRWLGDISYRYGRVGADTANNGNIAPISTNRLQFGAGIRF